MKTASQIQELIMKCKNDQEMCEDILYLWGCDIIDECAEMAEMWKSTTPNWTSEYVKTVKTQIK